MVEVRLRAGMEEYREGSCSVFWVDSATTFARIGDSRFKIQRKTPLLQVVLRDENIIRFAYGYTWIDQATILHIRSEQKQE